MDKNTPTKLKPFIFHGMDLTFHKSSQEAVGPCCFCGKDAHFYCNVSTGQFNCKSCHESGNGPSFLQKLIEYSLKATRLDDYKTLAAERNLTVESLKAFKVCKSIIDNCWLMPAFNEKKKVANVFRCFKNTDGDWKAYPTAGCKLHPVGVHLLQAKQQRVMIAEGVWDPVAVHGALTTTARRGTRLVKTMDAKASLHSTTGVIGVPGSGNFDEDWFRYVDGLDAVLLFDNDWPRKHPTSGKTTKSGWDGMNRIGKLAGDAKKQPSALYRIKWGRGGFTKDLANGYDMKDLVNDNGSVKAIGFIEKHLERVKLVESDEAEVGERVATVDPLARSNFKTLTKDFQKHLHWTEMLEDTLAAMLGVIVSTDLGGEQLWLRVIGPPGSGKTTLAECFSVCKEHVFSQSIFTGFHSGYTGGGKNGKASKKDASLLPAMNGRTFVVKDGDTLLTAPGRDRILAELRDIYDGTSRAQYRNRKSANYEGLRISMIVCGTDSLRELNRSSLGERFLDIEILGGEETQPYLDRALDNAYEKVVGSLTADKEDAEDNEVKTEDAATYLKRCVLGYVNHLKDNLTELPVPKMTPTMSIKLIALGQVLAFMRAKVNRDKEGMIARPRPELATRLVGQLTKFAICIALGMNKKTIDKDVFRVVRKIGMTTAEGFPLEITALLVSYVNGLSTKQIAAELNLAETSVKRVLIDMQELDVINRRERPNKSGVRGRALHIWKLDKGIAALWKKAEA